MHTDIVLGWIAIGAAASLAAMIWPFRRGALGVALNLLTGIGGAIGMALVSYLVWPSPHTAPARLLFAAIGAIGALWLVHAAWSKYARGRTAPHA